MIPHFSLICLVIGCALSLIHLLEAVEDSVGVARVFVLAIAHFVDWHPEVGGCPIVRCLCLTTCPMTNTVQGPVRCENGIPKFRLAVNQNRYPILWYFELSNFKTVLR